MDMFNNLNNDDSLNDNTSFEMPEDFDVIYEYERLMEELDNPDPLDIIPMFDEDENFYQAIDNWDNGEYYEEPLDKYSRKGKQSYNKYKEDENEYKKEFAEELAMLYDLLEETNKFSKKLTKKYDSIDGSKAKGTSKYLTELIESILGATTNKLQIIKEINSLKKNIQELKIKSDSKYAKMNGDGSLEDDANSFFQNIMGVGRNNFVSALNGEPDIHFSNPEYSNDDDIEYVNSLPDAQDALHDIINDRLENEGCIRSEEADKYIIYENLKPELRILRSAADNTWEVIAVDKDEQRIIDYPVPSKRDLGKMKFSADGKYATDAYGRSYRVIEKFC
jgi:hypothetical protein